MTRSDIVQSVLSDGAVAVIRMEDPEKLKRVLDALLEGGLSSIEITMTVPRALALLEETARTMGDQFNLGVGSVIDATTARLAINAGAQYVVSPIYKREIIETAHRYGKPALPGAFTPTEVLDAYEHGADIVKVFPANVLGMAYFRAIKAPLPQVQIMPTGGVTCTNAGDWLKAGACAVGIGGALLDKQAIAEERYAVLTENARILLDNIAAARNA